MSATVGISEVPSTEKTAVSDDAEPDKYIPEASISQKAAADSLLQYLTLSSNITLKLTCNTTANVQVNSLLALTGGRNKIFIKEICSDCTSILLLLSEHTSLVRYPAHKD